MKNNVCDNIALRNCTGCGICASVCGVKAINIQFDNEGFYKPVINENKCVECGICKKSCYRYDQNLIQSDDICACYAAINKDKNQLKSSSSGGVSRVLMEECIKQGYKIFGCSYDIKENIAKSIVAFTTEDLDQFYGSKYFQSFTVDGFNEILKNRTNQKYAIFGTPCQIYAFSQTSQYNRHKENYLLVDIFCHGCPSINLWKSYLKYVNKCTGIDSYDRIVFRSKTHAWHEYCFDFFSKSKQYSSKKSGDPFFEIFFDMDVMNMACYKCILRSTMAYTDIRLGDFWGKKYDTNTTGVSAVIIKSPKGAAFFDAVKNKLDIEKTTFEQIVKAQSYGKTHKYNEERRRFLMMHLLDGTDLKIVKNQYLKMFPIKVRVKKLLKYIIKCCPNSIYFPLKKFIHSN